MTKKVLLTLLCGAIGLLPNSNLIAADSPDLENFAKGMKRIGKFNKEQKADLEAKSADKIAKDTAEVAKIYTDMVGFWKARKVEDATKWSEESAAAATAASAAAKAGDWDKVKASVGAVTKNCKGCHDAHREKLDDGSYKIK
ncbi:MAG: cytochrome c [Opitutaceae bacterium]|nr:cytochrome c [Verrucomicrobiales bacterium]